MEETTHYRPRGVPRWTLWASIPVVLALGFVVGMAVAAYTADDPTSPGTHTTVIAPTATGANNAPASAGTSQTDTSWRILPTTPGSSVSPIPGQFGEHPVETTDGPTAPVPPPLKFTGPANNITEARKALASDFGVFAHKGITFRVEYQRMAHTNRGSSVVGMIDPADYPNWEKALKEAPDALKTWLQDAAKRVLSASSRDGFHIAWAVVAAPYTRPAGFADNEVTPMDNDTFLVIRRLASTLDHTKTEISLRSVTSLQDSAANKQVTSGEPWATYGPVIRFDGDDLYRPIRLAGARPKK